MPRAVPIQSIKRALDALDYLTEDSLGGEGASLQSVATHLGVGASTAHNILRTMIHCGYVSRDSDHRYHLGAKCADINRGITFSRRMLANAEVVLHGLAERTGESVVLVTLVHGRRRPLLRVQGHEVIRVNPAFDESGVFFAMVTGRVLAAWAAPEELDSILEVNGLPGPHWNDLDTREALARALAVVRHAGYAEGVDTRSSEVYSLAVPVLDAAGHLIAALGMYLPSSRAEASRLEESVQELRAAATRISGT